MRSEDVANFVVLAECRSLLAAARALGTSQPTLSKSVARLERALGTRVLERLPRGIALTDAGRAFLPHARSVTAGLRDGLATVRDLRAGRAGTVRIGVGVSVPPTLLVEALAPVLEAAPGLAVEVIGGMSDSLSRSVAVGECDLAVTNVPPDAALAVRWDPLFPDPMLPMAARSHPLAAARRIDWRTLSQQRWITPAAGTTVRAWFERLFVERDLPVPSQVISLRQYPVHFDMAAGLGAIALMPASARPLGRLPQVVVLRAPADWVSDRSVGVVLRTGAEPSPAVRRVLERLRAVARKRPA